jgi:putative spermidine/putrescine transport system substrate-binding protein
MRYDELQAAKKIPAALNAKLPPASSYKNVVFPTLEQQNATKAAVTKQWDQVVGANVK